jgi:hypothetical protein
MCFGNQEYFGGICQFNSLCNVMDTTSCTFAPQNLCNQVTGTNPPVYFIAQCQKSSSLVPSFPGYSAMYNWQSSDQFCQTVINQATATPAPCLPIPRFSTQSPQLYRYLQCPSQPGANINQWTCTDSACQVCGSGPSSQFQYTPCNSQGGGAYQFIGCNVANIISSPPGSSEVSPQIQSNVVIIVLLVVVALLMAVCAIGVCWTQGVLPGRRSMV